MLLLRHYQHNLILAVLFVLALAALVRELRMADFSGWPANAVRVSAVLREDDPPVFNPE